jgi:hypothetical protein
MKRTKSEIKEQTEAFLNERYMFTQRDDARPQELSYYNGALKAVEFLGFEWKRDENGKHTLIEE